MSKKKPLRKTRYKFTLDGYHYDVDVYSKFKRLIVVEVEFESEEEADKFKKPKWLDKDVSKNKKYSNKKLWESIQK